MRKILLNILLLTLFLCPLVWGQEQAKGSYEESVSFSEKALELSNSGRYEEAIPYAKKALEIREEVLGKDHPDVATGLHNLAKIYQITGRNVEAEALYKRSLKIREKLGKEHDVAASLNNLALIYGVTGRYPEAEALYKRSLEIREKILGKEHPDVAQSLNNLGSLYYDTRRYAEAEPLHRRALEIRQKLLGKEHLDVALSLNNLAMVYGVTGRYAEAEPLYKRSLEIREKVLGKEHLVVALSLDALALLYGVTGRYAEAEPMYKRSLEIKEKVLGKEHFGVAWSLNNLGAFYYDTRRYAEAEPLHRRALEIREKVLGKDHPDVALSLNNLGMVYWAIGRYTEAEPIYKRALEIRENVFGKEHLDVAQSLHNLASLYQTTGRYTEAESLHKRALEIREKLSGKEHPDVAWSLNNLGSLYYDTRRYTEAEPLHRRALEIREKVFGKEHSDVALSLHNLAMIYQDTGRNAEAGPLYKRSLEIREKILGKEHLDVAWSLNNLAMVYEVTGRYGEAEPLYKRALEIREKILGKEHPDVAQSLNNLADLYRKIFQYTEAEALFKRSLQIREKVLGKDHIDVARSLNNLALVYFSVQRYAEAESLFEQALGIMEKVLGKDHPDVATALEEMGVLYSVTNRHMRAQPLIERSLEIKKKLFGEDNFEIGKNLFISGMTYLFSQRYQEAKQLLKRALEIYQSKLGKEHPNLAIILTFAAISHALANEHLDAHGMFCEGMRIEEKNRENVFAFLTEKQKLRYMDQWAVFLIFLLKNTIEAMRNDGTAVHDSLDIWLRWKGAVMEAQGRYLNALMYSEDREIGKKFEDLSFIRETIARLRISGPGKMNVEHYNKRLAELNSKKEALEAELNRLSKDFALGKTVGRADAKRISEILASKGRDSIYIDFGNVGSYDFKENKFTESGYISFVLLPGKDPVVKLVEIADTEGLDVHIRAYLEEIRRAREYGEPPRERILRTESKAIYELVIKPIEPYLEGKKHLYISPDGNLNLIPFEVLMTPDGKYLIEDYNITYVAAGRDIMRFTDKNVAKGEPIIIADPDYDMGLEEKTKVAKALGITETRAPASLARDAKDLRFKRLPDTKQEADAIEKILKENQKASIKNYQDKKALEDVLLTAKSPRILHLATHGYFLKDEEVKPQPMLGFMVQGREQMVDIGIENPMLRSGIVLAGANASLKEGRDDGIVSAEKILGLRLKGTDLVVLSACDTGTGEVKSGEGVFGLKRSFILSGAKTVVMSLWSIPSKETTELMTEFYTLMAQGKTKAEALREARLNLMKNKPNPFYWGAFVMVGNPD